MLVILTGLTSLFLNSCDKEEPIPGYLYIPEIQLDVRSDRAQGSDAHDIQNAWVYVDGELIGSFELPARIPVIADGDKDLIILAGIKKNGLNSGRVIYPFYEAYEVTHNFSPTRIDTIIPVISYRDNIQFKWLEDFEDETLSLTKTGSNSTVDTFKLITDSTIVYDYNGVTERISGGSIIDTGFQIFEFSSAQFYDLPRNEAIYLEVNFRSDANLIIGIYPLTSSVVSGVPIVTMYPTDGEWKKVYVSLSEDVNAAAYLGANFRVFFAVQKNDDQKHEVYLDNIKLLHF